ncbi:MAG: PilZ domain-containing protein [Nitrospinota bacterium]
MILSEYFEIEKNVTIKVQSDSESKRYPSVVKKIKEELIAFLLSPSPEKPEDVPQGKLVSVIAEKDGIPFSILSRIVSNKTFPIVVLKLERLEQAESLKESKITTEEPRAKKPAPLDMAKGFKDKEPSKNTHAEERESARIEDSFPMEFYVITPEQAKEKMKDYLLRRTKDRRESAVSTGIYAGYNETEILEKIPHIDKATVDIILDIYKKIAALTTLTTQQSKPWVEDENVGNCVDISGNGLKMICTKRLNKNDIVKIIISPPRAQPPFSVSALGEVMRVDAIPPQPNQTQKYSIGIRYYAMHDDDMELITQYTFQLQREMLRMRRKERTIGD